MALNVFFKNENLDSIVSQRYAKEGDGIKNEIEKNPSSQSHVKNVVKTKTDEIFKDFYYDHSKPKHSIKEVNFLIFENQIKKSIESCIKKYIYADKTREIAILLKINLDKKAFNEKLNEFNKIKVEFEQKKEQIELISTSIKTKNNRLTEKRIARTEHQKNAETTLKKSVNLENTNIKTEINKLISEIMEIGTLKEELADLKVDYEKIKIELEPLKFLEKEVNDLEKECELNSKEKITLPEKIQEHIVNHNNAIHKILTRNKVIPSKENTFTIQEINFAKATKNAKSIIKETGIKHIEKCCFRDEELDSLKKEKLSLIEKCRFRDEELDSLKKEKLSLIEKCRFRDEELDSLKKEKLSLMDKKLKSLEELDSLKKEFSLLDEQLKSLKNPHTNSNK